MSSAFFALFQSTHPVWDATYNVLSDKIQINVSIHASRVGCDGSRGILERITILFQSTHPVWDATNNLGDDVRPGKFQSTHPVWDATQQATLTFSDPPVSIHASRVGCDSVPCMTEWEVIWFQSTHPVWDATKV